VVDPVGGGLRGLLPLGLIVVRGSGAGWFPVRGRLALRVLDQVAHGGVGHGQQRYGHQSTDDAGDDDAGGDRQDDGQRMQGTSAASGSASGTRSTASPMPIPTASMNATSTAAPT
jgi:hypothetical protein